MAVERRRVSLRSAIPITTMPEPGNTIDHLLFYYLPDYLGNVEHITDMDGEPYQYFLYTPWGEAIKEEKASSNTWESPYRFNGKEQDDETGLFYYGARYYDPKISVWLSVDRMASKYPDMSPYNFSGNNTINLIDPNGDSLKATQEAWDYTLLGLKVMGIDNLFSYNSSNGMISFDNNADLSSYSSEQLETIENFAIPAGSSTKNASIRVEDGNTFLPEANGSLDNRPNGPSDGVTAPTRVTGTPRYGPGRIGQGEIFQGYDYHIMEQEIILRRNPRNALGSPFSPLKGLSAIHEIAHVRFSMTNGNESYNNAGAHNTRVEDFMRGVRSHYNKNGVGVARKPTEHN